MAAAAVLLAAWAFAPSVVRAQAPSGKPWVSTWGTGMSSPTNDPSFATNSYNGNNVFNDQVVRQVVHASLGGNQVRIRLSNELGTVPVTVSAAHIALTDTGANIIAGTDQTLTFNGGSPSVTIPAGAPEVSDLAALTVPANATLSVSLYFATATTVTVGHPYSQESTFISPAGSGDVSGAVALPLDAVDPQITQWPLLSGVEVRAKNARVLVAFGSSITNGNLSTVDANHRWTDYLAQRFYRQGLPVGVVNASVVANALLTSFHGGPALARFDRDVVARPGAAYVIINDIIGVEMQQATTLSNADRAQEIIGGLRQYITRSHAAGIKAYAATVIPLGGASTYTPDYEVKRQIINAFIRTGDALDGFVDFDAVVADPADPTRILPAYDGGDHHHLNDTGYKLVADTFDLALFQ